MTELEMERWAEIYCANHIAQRSAGMTFERFLQRPAAILQALIYDQALPLEEDQDFYSLLPAQRLVMARVVAAQSLEVVADEMEATLTAHTDCRLAGDGYQEPLRHHSYDVSRTRSRRVRGQ